MGPAPEPARTQRCHRGASGAGSLLRERLRNRFILFDRAFGVLMVLRGVVALIGGAYLFALQA